MCPEPSSSARAQASGKWPRRPRAGLASGPVAPPRQGSSWGGSEGSREPPVPRLPGLGATDPCTLQCRQRQAWPCACVQSRVAMCVCACVCVPMFTCGHTWSRAFVWPHACVQSCVVTCACGHVHLCGHVCSCACAVTCGHVSVRSHVVMCVCAVTCMCVCACSRPGFLGGTVGSKAPLGAWQLDTSILVTAADAPAPSPGPHGLSDRP